MDWVDSVASDLDMLGLGAHVGEVSDDDSDDDALTLRQVKDVVYDKVRELEKELYIEQQVVDKLCKDRDEDRNSNKKKFDRLNTSLLHVTDTMQLIAHRMKMHPPPDSMKPVVPEPPLEEPKKKRKRRKSQRKSKNAAGGAGPAYYDGDGTTVWKPRTGAISPDSE